MKTKIMPLLAAAVLCGGCAANKITSAPETKAYSFEDNVRKYWQGFADADKNINTVYGGMGTVDSEKAFQKYVEMHKKYAPHMFEDFKTVDRVLGWKEGTYLRWVFFGFDTKGWAQEKLFAPHECTSWAVLPDFAAYNQVLIHKNRDTGLQNRKIVAVKHQSEGKNGYIGITGYGKLTPNMGMNSVGLVVVMNSGDPSGKENKVGFSTPMLARILLENCSNATEALEMLRKLVAEKAYSHGDKGSIWFIGDKDVVYCVENDSERFSVQKAVSGVVIRANAWHNPDMIPYSQRNQTTLINHARRENAVRQALFEDGKKYNRPVTPEIMAAASRVNVIKEEPKCYPVCGNRTVCGATFSIDREFPADLSTMYATFGPPRMSFVIPIPVTIDEFPAELLNCEFSRKTFAAAASGKKAITEDNRAVIEKVISADYRVARENAREMLRKSYSEKTRLKARKMLNDAFKKNWDKLAGYL